MTNECGQQAEQRSGYGDKHSLSSEESLACERESYINAFVDFQPVGRFENRSGVRQ